MAFLSDLYFFPINKKSIKIIKACTFDLLFDSPPEEYKACTTVKIEYKYGRTIYNLLFEDKIITTDVFLNNIFFYCVTGKNKYIVAKLKKSWGRLYIFKLFINSKCIASIDIRDTLPLGLRVILADKKYYDSIYTNKIDNILDTQLVNPEELQENIWNLALKIVVKRGCKFYYRKEGY